MAHNAGSPGQRLSPMTVHKDSPTPTLDELHSGVPKRLAADAAEAKDRTYKLSTGPPPQPVRHLRLPPDVDRATFDKAIQELRQAIGAEHVTLVDGPLEDGWYCERPCALPAAVVQTN